MGKGEGREGTQDGWVFRQISMVRLWCPAELNKCSSVSRRKVERERQAGEAGKALALTGG